MPSILFTQFLHLHRERELFERPFGTVGDGRGVDFTTLYATGSKTLNAIDIKTVSAFEERLAASGLGAPNYFDLYSADGVIRDDLRQFVSRCLKFSETSSEANK